MQSVLHSIHILACVQGLIILIRCVVVKETGIVKREDSCSTVVPGTPVLTMIHGSRIHHVIDGHRVRATEMRTTALQFRPPSNSTR